MGSILSAVHLSPAAMGRLCLLALFALSAFSNNCSANTMRIERDACEEKQEEVQNCQKIAYEEYTTAFTAGKDDRPDWMARKSCNYITATIEECTNQLVGDCGTEEEVNKMKDEQIEGMLKQLSDTIEEWDSEKCPAIKAYMDRNPTEDEEKTQEEEAASVDTAAQEKEEEEKVEEENADESEEETAKVEDGEEEENADDQVDSGNEVTDDSVENTDDEEQTKDAGGEDGNTGDESNEEPDSGSETAAASLSLVLVMYKICSA